MSKKNPGEEDDMWKMLRTIWESFIDIFNLFPEEDNQRINDIDRFFNEIHSRNDWDMIGQDFRKVGADIQRAMDRFHE